jgi:nucleotide-binding universal stress UspA family protein
VAVARRVLVLLPAAIDSPWKEREMIAQNQNTERFVVIAGVDSSAAASSVVATAARMAGSNPGAELHLVQVLDNFEPAPHAEIPSPASGTEILERAREHLEQLGQVAAATFKGRVVGHLASGEPWREIVQFAERLTADLVVVGSQNLTGVRRLALGSVSEHVVRKSKCPVLVVRKKDYQTRDVPEIEPPCPDCLVKQRETRGESLWCQRHSTHHPQARIHFELPQSFGLGSGLLRP